LNVPGHGPAGTVPARLSGVRPQQWTVSSKRTPQANVPPALMLRTPETAARTPAVCPAAPLALITAR
jgi:hypothetical protein